MPVKYPFRWLELNASILQATSPHQNRHPDFTTSTRTCYSAKHRNEGRWKME